MVLNYLKFSVYRICEEASRLIALLSVFNNLQGDRFNISILFYILKVFYSEEKSYQWVVLLNKTKLSNQQSMGLVTDDK